MPTIGFPPIESDELRSPLTVAVDARRLSTGELELRLVVPWPSHWPESTDPRRCFELEAFVHARSVSLSLPTPVDPSSDPSPA